MKIVHSKFRIRQQPGDKGDVPDGTSEGEDALDDAEDPYGRERAVPGAAAGDCCEIAAVDHQEDRGRQTEADQHNRKDQRRPEEHQDKDTADQHEDPTGHGLPAGTLCLRVRDGASQHGVADRLHNFHTCDVTFKAEGMEAKIFRT